MRNRNVFNLRKSLPCMSWSPKNLYNLWRRTMGPLSEEITFQNTTEATVFQQRWKSKAAVRAYHGDFIPEKVFKRWYLPDTLPDVRPRRKVSDKMTLAHFALRNEKEKELEEEIEKRGMAPVGSLMFSEVERRLDVFLFRCCFAHSVYEARRLIIHGYVTLNGRKHSRPNTRLAPGDMVHLDPKSIRFFMEPHGDCDNVIEGNQEKIEAEEKAANAAATAEEENDEKNGEEVEKNKKGNEKVGDEMNNKKVEESEVGKGSGEPIREAEVSPTDAATEGPVPNGKEKMKPGVTPFYLPAYASPWLFIPAYIEVSFQTCSAIYVRHPTARPGYSEIPTPYDADGALIRYAWEWYVQRRPRMRSKSQLSRMPEDRVLTVLSSLHRDRRYLENPADFKAKNKKSVRTKPVFKLRSRRPATVSTVGGGLPGHP